MLHSECRKACFSILLIVLIGLPLAFSTACSNTAAIQKHLAQGEELLTTRKFREAAMEFRAAAELDKNSAEAHWGLARAYENQGKFSETVEELRQAIALAPANLDAKAKLGNYFLLLKPPQTAETQKLLDEIFKQNPNFIEGHILKASLLDVQNRPETEILAALDRAVELDPKRIESYLSIARFFMKRDKGAEAEATIQKAISANPQSALGYLEYGRFLSFTDRAAEAEAQFKKAVEIDSKNFEAREGLAEFYVGEGQYERAEQVYQDLVRALENSSEARMKLADFYNRVNRDGEAVQALESILKDEPEYAVARYRLGEIYLAQKEFAKTSEQVERLLAVNSHDAEALLLRARMRLQENKTEEAVKDLEEILKKQPSQRDALYYMADARLSLGQIEEARAFIGDLEKYHPSYPFSKLLQIQASFVAGETEKALRQANELLQTIKTVRPDANVTGQELAGLRVRALIARGSAHLELGKLNEARADFEEVQKLSPNSANSYVNLARVSTAAGNPATAKQFLEKALLLDNNNFDALSGLVNVLKQQQQFGEAHAQIEKLMSDSGQQSNLPALYYLNADIFQAEKNADAAEAALQKAMELDANYLPAYSAYAALLVERNQTDRAVEQYQKILEKRPSAPVYALLGMLEDARNNFDESEKHYRKALELAPEMPIAANNLAWNIAAYNRGNLDEALRLAQASVVKNTNVAGFYDTLGLVFYKKNLHAQAVEQFKKAIALDGADAKKTGKPATAAYRVRLGMALASVGDKPGAKREAEAALQNQQDLSEQEKADARNLLAGL